LEGSIGAGGRRFSLIIAIASHRSLTSPPPVTSYPKVLTSPYMVLALALPCPALPCPALPCPAWPCLALHGPAWPCPALHSPVLPGLVCPALPCPALPWSALVCPALPCPAMPCPALSLSARVFTFLSLPVLPGRIGTWIWTMDLVCPFPCWPGASCMRSVCKYFQS
jgi:hypothetical protein